MYVCMNFVYSCVWQLFLMNKRWDDEQQICGHRTFLTPIWSITEYGVSSSSAFISLRCTILTNRSSDRWTFGMALDNSLIENAVDEWWGHLWSCIRANYGHKSNWCGSNIHSATCHEMFHFYHTRYGIFKLYLCQYLTNSNFWLPKVV